MASGPGQCGSHSELPGSSEPWSPLLAPPHCSFPESSLTPLWRESFCLDPSCSPLALPSSLPSAASARFPFAPVSSGTCSLPPPVCPLNCSSHPDHWDPPPARKAGWALAPSQTAARSWAAPASQGPSVPCAAPGPAGHCFSSSSFSLSAQAQQWGPATGGPASQGEVAGGLHDSCQRLLSLPAHLRHPRDPSALALAPPEGPEQPWRHSPSPRLNPEPHHSPHPHFPGGL